MFQFLEQARKNNNNPMDLFKQVTKNYSPEQMNSLFEKAKQFGINDDIIQQVQNEINAK
jgi:hypothetical protein